MIYSKEAIPIVALEAEVSTSRTEWSRSVAAVAVSIYLAVTLWLSYAVWGPYDGVEHDPAWASDDRLWPALIVLHVAAGVAVRRWWALVLPVAWVVLSAPAGGYDTPVWIGLAFYLPLWLAAVALGVVAGRALAPAARVV